MSSWCVNGMVCVILVCEWYGLCHLGVSLVWFVSSWCVNGMVCVILVCHWLDVCCLGAMLVVDTWIFLSALVGLFFPSVYFLQSMTG